MQDLMESSEAQISEEDQELLEEKIMETLEWMEHNDGADSAQLNNKRKELENTAKPIQTKIYQAKLGAAANDRAGGKKKRGGRR